VSQKSIHPLVFDNNFGKTFHFGERILKIGPHLLNLLSNKHQGVYF